MTLTLGPARRFVPICVRHPYGYVGGPSGYVESETAKAPIIAEDDMSDEQTIIGESIRADDRAATALALATLDAMEAMRRDGWCVVLGGGGDAVPIGLKPWCCEASDMRWKGGTGVYRLSQFSMADTPFEAVDGVRKQIEQAEKAKGE